jgi:hypothetical protein
LVVVQQVVAAVEIPVAAVVVEQALNQTWPSLRLFQAM